MSLISVFFKILVGIQTHIEVYEMRKLKLNSYLLSNR